MEAMTGTIYPCGCCHVFFPEYEILLQHLYWVHGTCSRRCPRCPVRLWPFAAHICDLIPVSPISATETDMSEIELPEKNLVIEDSSSGISSGSPPSYCRDTITAGARVTMRESPYCYCGRNLDEDMIACEGERCKYEWYHYKCVGVTVPPPGDWFCRECCG